MESERAGRLDPKDRPTAQQLQAQGAGVDGLGITCPRCGWNRFWVTKRRGKPGMVVRRTECRKCGNVTYTKETILTSE